MHFLLCISRETYNNRNKYAFGLSSCFSPVISSEAGFNLCEDFKGLGVCNSAGGKGKKKRNMHSRGQVWEMFQLL